MHCHECGARNEDTSRFCLKCGTALVRITSSPLSSPPAGQAPTHIDSRHSPEDMPTVIQATPEPLRGAVKPPSPAFSGPTEFGRVDEDHPTEWAWPAEPGWAEAEHRAPHEPAPTEVPRGRRRRFPHILLTCGIVSLILILVLVAAVVAAWFWLGLHRTNQTVKLIPADSAMVVSFSPDPRQALQYNHVENIQALVPLLAAIPGVLDIVDADQTQLASDLRIDFRSDILPWIGREASLAVLDVEQTQGREVPALLLTVATRNETRSDEFLADIWDLLEEEGYRFEEETYRGTHVVFQVPDRPGSFAPAFATANHLILVGTDLDTLHTALDLAAGDGKRTLANQEAFEAVLRELPANRVGYVYMDAGVLAGQLAQETIPMEAIQTLEGLGAAFKLSSSGLVVDYVLRYDPDKMSTEHKDAMQRPVTERATADLLPADTVGYWSEQDAEVTWDGLLNMLRSISDLEDPLWELDQTLEEIEIGTGFNLRDDLLSQLTGEYALALVPDRTGFPGLSDLPLGLVLIAEARRPSNTRSTLGELGQALAYAGIATSPPIQDRDVTYVDTGAGWSPAYGFAGDYLVMGTSPEAVEVALEGEDDALSGASLFQDALQRLPKQARGYLIADADSTVDAILKALTDSDRKFYERELEPYVESLQAIGFSLGSMDDEGQVIGTLIVLTK